MTTADTLLCSLEISADQLLAEVRQFEGAVASTSHRREIAHVLRDLASELTNASQRLDLSPSGAEALRQLQQQQPAKLN